jgi:type VI secretion system protein ImpK
MTPKFASAVDPIFLYVLGVLDRISANDPPLAEDVREGVQNRFREADAKLSEQIHREGWELAKYALASWIDDVLIEAPWPGRDWWENNSLEFAYFNTRDRATQFFRMAKDAAALTRRDAIEVFYVCVILGFRGLYAMSEAAFLADQLGLSPDLDSWTARTAKLITLGQGRPPLYPAPRPGEGAPPLEGKFLLVSYSLAAIVLVLCVAVVGYYVFVV